MHATHWNYRVLIANDGALELYEVQYDDKGNPDYWSEEPLIVAYDIEDLKSIVDNLIADINKYISGELKPIKFIVETNIVKLVESPESVLENSENKEGEESVF
jgi:hypothetical protein